MPRDARAEAIDKVLSSLTENSTKEDIERAKRDAGAEYGLAEFIRNSEVIARAREKGMHWLIPLLRKRPMRSVSGIVNIAIMTTSDCPHGRCTYCPKGECAPNSYTGFEPATMRGIQNRFDAYAQVQARVQQLHEIGHPTDKCEVIIQGGTFPAQPVEYQEKFIKGMYDALNGTVSPTLDGAIRANENARNRCIGLTIETRPDWCFESHIDGMLGFGATRVEIGVQTLDPAVLAKTRRGHSLEDVWKATQVAKDSLLKVCYHMMPGLYSTPEKDVEMFRKLFDDERYRPDMLKIYPLLIMRGTEMYDEWLAGKVRPYTSDEAADVISEAYKHFPYYVRVMRVQRDIPAYLIEDGVKKSNLRQLVERKLVEKGVKTGEIRYREVGLNVIKGNVDVDELEPELIVRGYTASGGEERFISYEDKGTGIIFGFLRLRKPVHQHRKEVTWDSAGVRELHVYGEMQPIGVRGDAPQHKGMGRSLLDEAERIAKEEWDCRKMLVISGVGVREYYRRLGYSLEGPYMGKRLQ
ncbi:MAG: tRNA uridine(34) 5-carboxymethylaminomethyl modification radical SAM/GNAT enzyme Elp3 [Candidatus Micrarchaeota archaeon]|nr:tRNA uridine(34) 5-carboxymethylaminomethyl modification radical SAM/GNAT enzyme Elp3 [Candidatus Micrarchaeota archaeon]